MAFVTLADGAEIYYETFGAGMPLVFLHAGLGFDSSYLKNAFLPLAAKAEIKLVFFDFRGNGKSSRRPTDLEFTVETLVEDVEELRSKLELGRIVLFGHSFGGVIVQEYAFRFPGKLQGLILDSTYPAFGAEIFAELERRASPAEMKNFLEAFGSPASDDETFGRAVELVLPLYFHGYDNRKAASFLSEMRFSAAAFNRSGELLPIVNTLEKLVKIKTPALILAGKNDLFGLAQAGEKMSEKIQNSRSIIFEQSGHFPFLEEPEKYLKTVADFVLNLPE
ncbi:MAG: alpha/beta hydrolase [Acidobacteriota bacterium]|nr:alpha/beta hydrolase [Acidobacteriota bacterium]